MIFLYPLACKRFLYFSLFTVAFVPVIKIFAFLSFILFVRAITPGSMTPTTGKGATSLNSLIA